VRSHSRLIRAVLIATGALAAVFAAPLATSADTRVSHSGLYGVHYLADSSEYPAVRCTYNSQQAISSIRVRDPFVFARNRTSGVDTQLVGWYFRVQRAAVGASTWTEVGNSAIQRKVATDQQVADFSPITRAVAPDASRQFRVIVTMLWYNAARTGLEGYATHRADWYSWVTAPSFQGSCPGGIL
jgi:hypothetical protein